MSQIGGIGSVQPKKSMFCFQTLMSSQPHVNSVYSSPHHAVNCAIASKNVGASASSSAPSCVILRMRG